jgi:CheY-like chemotaxis protein
MSQSSDAAMTATETLLVVENETAIKMLVQMALERHGYAVLTAESGSEALRLAAAHQGPIDLLITDVVMPDLRGPDLARRLVADRPGSAPSSCLVTWPMRWKTPLPRQFL